MSDEIPALPPQEAPPATTGPAASPLPEPAPEIDLTEETKAMREFLAQERAKEEAIRAEQDPELAAVEAECDESRAEAP